MGINELTIALGHQALLDEPLLADAYDEAKRTVARIPDFYPGPVLAAALASETSHADDAEAMRFRTLQSDPAGSLFQIFSANRKVVRQTAAASNQNR